MSIIHSKRLLRDPIRLSCPTLGVTTLPPYAEIGLASWLLIEINGDHPLTLGDLKDKGIGEYRELDTYEVMRDYLAALHCWAARFNKNRSFN